MAFAAAPPLINPALDDSFGNLAPEALHRLAAPSANDDPTGAGPSRSHGQPGLAAQSGGRANTGDEQPAHSALSNSNLKQ